MNEEIYRDAFYLIQKINDELRNNKVDSIEVLIVGQYDVWRILDILLVNSQSFRTNYCNHRDSLVYIVKYIEFLTEKFQNNQVNGILNFDDDIKKSKIPNLVDPSNSKKFKNNPLVDKLTFDSEKKKYIVTYKSSVIDMTPEEVDETIGLISNAFYMFESIYEDKKITGVLHTGEEIYLELRATELLHILGINRKQVLNNDKLKDLLNIKSDRISSYDILCRIVDDFRFNKDLVQMYEDINLSNLATAQFSSDTDIELLPFHKIRGKTISFINSAPLTHPKLVATLAKGRKLSQNSNSNIAMISQTVLSNNYDWVYMGL